MTTTVRVVPNGLVTDPSRIVAGDGGLIVANNVVCRAPGLVEPRPSLTQTRNPDLISEGGIFRDGRFVNEWDGNYMYAATDDLDITAVCRVNDRMFTVEDVRSDYLLRCEQFQARQMWMFRNTLRMVDGSGEPPNAGDTGAFSRLPGVARPIVAAATVSAPGIGYYALDADETAAYRVVIVRYIVDSLGNRVPMMGPPSDRIVARNTGGSWAGVEITVNVTGTWRLGDEIQLYRTATNGVAGADPGDELVFVSAFQLPQSQSWIYGDVFVTAYADGAKPGTFGGAALYTNASQEGALRANYRLRYANDLAAFQGKMFYAGGSAGWRKTVTALHIGDVDGDDKSRTLVSYQPSSAAPTWTSGDATVTGVPVSAYIRPGMLLTESGQRPDDPNPTGLYGIITEIVGTTVTLDREQSSTGSGTVIAWDWIAIENDDGLVRRIYAPYITQGGTAFDLTGGGLDSAVMPVAINAGSTVRSLASGGVERAFSLYQTAQERVMGAWPRITSTTPVTGLSDYSSNIVITAEYDASFSDVSLPGDVDTVSIRTQEIFAVTSSKPFAFTETLATTFGDSSIRLANRDGNVATLWWSKANQPEAVPLLNFVTLGDQSEPIVRIFATTDRIWVLKTDGLWMGYGDGDLPDSLTWQVVDATFRMCPTPPSGQTRDDGLPEAVQTWAVKCRDTVYAWTLRGIVALGTAGVSRVDDAIVKQIRCYTPTINETNSPQDGGVSGFFCSASPRDGVVVFGVGASMIPTLDGPTGSSPDAVMFALSVDSGTWATWSTSHLYWPTGCGESERGLLLFGSPFGWTSSVEFPAFDSVDSVGADQIRPYRGDLISPVTANQYYHEVLSVAGRLVTLQGADPDNLPPIGSVLMDSVGGQFLVTGHEEYDLPPINPVIIVDRPGMATGFPNEIFLPFVSTMTFSANQVPVTEKHFLDHYLGFQRIRGGTEYKIRWRGRQQTTDTNESTVVYDSPESPNYPKTLQYDVEHDQCMSTPREASRSDGLETTIVFAQAGVYWALDSFALSYDQETRITTPNARRR